MRVARLLLLGLVGGVLVAACGSSLTSTTTTAGGGAATSAGGGATTTTGGGAATTAGGGRAGSASPGTAVVNVGSASTTYTITQCRPSPKGLTVDGKSGSDAFGFALSPILIGGKDIVGGDYSSFSVQAGGPKADEILVSSGKLTLSSDLKSATFSGKNFKGGDEVSGSFACK